MNQNFNDLEIYDLTKEGDLSAVFTLLRIDKNDNSLYASFNSTIELH